MWPQPEVGTAATLSPVSRLPPGVEVESCPSLTSAAATGRAPPPAPASARLVQDAHPGGAPAASRPRLSAATLNCSPFISVAQCGAARRERGPGGRGGEEGGSAGLSSPAGSFCQATKSWLLSGSGLKFIREIEAGARSAPCEMAGGGQRARGCGFVAANHPRRLCLLHKNTRASTPSQALFPTLLGLKARGFALRESPEQIWHPPQLKICLPGGRC